MQAQKGSYALKIPLRIADGVPVGNLKGKLIEPGVSADRCHASPIKRDATRQDASSKTLVSVDLLPTTASLLRPESHTIWMYRHRCQKRTIIQLHSFDIT